MYDTDPHLLENLNNGTIKILNDHRLLIPELIKEVFCNL